MSVYLESKADLYAAFQKKTGLSIPLADLIFSKPAVNDNPAFPQNTKVRVTVVDSNTTYQGSEIFYFNRLDFANLANYPAPDYPPVAGAGTSVYAMLQDIKSRMGLSLTANDLEETFVTTSNGKEFIVLKAKTTSLGWTGQFTLPLGVKPLLSSIFARDYLLWS